ncbi:MAG: tryptophan--tRNA ligase [Clostridia bacterium]|nr:tryptophan--tRNA ligase [Clostridia bacterium]
MDNNNTERKKVIFSAIQPSGMLTLGNYLGALKNWVAMQDEYNCIYAIADLHAITVRQEPAKLRKQIIETFALLLAVGIDPQKSLVFIQSHVPQHAELAWILNCNTQFGELGRMTQFKEKSQRHADNINVGLFAYPSLMAADILLYQADLVPVGADQKQHLELTRDIATRMNGVYNNLFTVPEPYIPKIGARVMSLQDPTKKMSKSDDNPNGYVAILDKPEDIMRKFKRAVTDSEAVVKYAEGKDGINNLMGIYSAVTGRSFDQIEAEFEGKGYGDFKTAVGEAVCEALRPVRERFDALMKDKAALEDIYREGAQAASRFAARTLSKVQKKVGLIGR